MSSLVSSFQIHEFNVGRFFQTESELEKEDLTNFVFSVNFCNILFSIVKEKAYSSFTNDSPNTSKL